MQLASDNQALKLGVVNHSSGVLIIGHGTRDQVGTSQFFDLERRLAEHLSPLPVRAGLLEFQEPTIPEAWHSLTSTGVRHIHVAPLLLFAAGHAKQDIPEIVADCARSTPGVTYDQSRPISRHHSLVELVVKRIREITSNNACDSARTAVIMVGRGSHDPCAQADMRVLTAIVQQRLSVAEVTTAFYAMASPKLPTVIDSVAATGRFDSIVVYPHLLFEGRLNQAIVRQTEEAAERLPEVRFETANYLGPEPAVAESLAARIQQASERGTTSLRTEN